MPRWAVALAALIVLGAVGGGVLVARGGGEEFPSEWDPRVEPIARWVANERGLDFDHPVEVRFLDEDEYREAATGGGSVDEGAEADEELDDTVALLRALGLVEGEVDLDEATDTIMDSGTLAFYDPSAKQVVARGVDLSPALRVTLAHELVHVLQDQHFELDRLEELSGSEAAVLRALAEGDALRIEDRYVADELSDDERSEYEADTAEQGEEARVALEEDVPPVLTALFASPYIFGPELVAYLERDGDEAIDAALGDLPSEAVLFNPLVTGTDAAEVELIEVAAPDGAEVLDDGEFGATAWYLVLAARLDPATALDATDGLVADGYVMYRDDDQVCVRARATGQTADDTEELVDALADWVDQSPDGTAGVNTVDGEVQLQSCDPGTEATVAGEVSVELFVLPVVRTQIYNQIVEAGASDEQATCYVEAIVSTVPSEDLLGDELTPEAEQGIGAAQQECL